MKMFKTVPIFILLFTGYLCNDEDAETSPAYETEVPGDLSPPKVVGKHVQNTSSSSAQEREAHDPERSLPTLVVAGVSIALVLLFILIVAVFWYASKKSQEGSIEINPIPYGEAGVSRTVPVPEN